MKIATKATLIGCVSFVLFLFGNMILGALVGLVIPGGDAFLNSYFHPLYFGVVILTSIVISCTYVIVKKINILLEELKKQ